MSQFKALTHLWGKLKFAAIHIDRSIEKVSKLD